jgi:hypothetical protein
MTVIVHTTVGSHRCICISLFLVEVEALDTDGLVRWLREDMKVDDFGDDEATVFRKQKIKGDVFLKSTMEEFVNLYKIPGGVAKRLVEIIQSYTEATTMPTSASIVCRYLTQWALLFFS